MLAGKHPVALLFDGNNVWVANTFDDSLMRLSPDGAVDATFPAGKGPGAPAFDGEHLWVANTGLELTSDEPPPGTVSKMTLTGEVVGEFPVGRWPQALAFDGQGIWVANLTDKTVMKLALDGSLVGEIELDLRPIGLAVVGDDMWVLTGTDDGGSGAITVLSPSLEVLATYSIAPPHPLALLYDGQSVWVGSSSDATVTRMAPDGTVLATIQLEGAPIALGFDGRNIWVTTAWAALFRLSLDGETLSVLHTANNPVAIAWDGRALWMAHPASPDVFSGTTTEGAVSRLEVHDAPTPTAPLRSGPEEMAPPDTDLARYVLPQDKVQQVPGCPGWTDLPGYDTVEFLLSDEIQTIAALFEGLVVQNALEASGCGRAEGPVETDVNQVVFQFASPEGATQFMERLRAPAYPFLIVSQPFLAISAGYSGAHDFEAWLQEMRPESFGPGAFAVETSAAFSAPIEELVGLRGHAEDDYHGWVRYGNLVSLLMVQAGGDLEELFGLRGTDRGERSAEEFLATRSGPFYTMEQFQDLLHAAYQGLREGANGPPVDLLDPPPLIAADGSAVVRLTNHPAMDLDPAWSPDGDRIAFTSKRDGNNEIYLMNADGSDVIRLTDHPARDSLPAWSPDGARIAFASERDGNLEIYVMNADGSGLTRLTNHAARDWDPAWSPEGARIAFSSVRDRPVEIPGGDIYVMNADGSAVTNLSNNPASDSSPAWSPDGARIAFISHRGTSYRGNTEYQGHAEIYVMNADGSDLTRLTDNPDHKGAPAWSPDGARIAFSFDREGYPEYEIFAINARGGIEVESTQTPASVVVIAPTPVPTPSPTPTPTPSPTPTPAALLESEVTIVEVATRPAIFRAGERVSYTVVVENRGPHVALRPKLVGSVSVALGSLDFLSSYGTCTGTVQSARTIVDCALDDLPPGQLAFVNVDGNLPAGASTVEHLFNVSGHWVESNPADNSAKDLAVVTPAAIPTPTSTPAAISTPAPGVITATYPVGDGPLALAFDGEHIWVAQGGDDTVMKLRASDGVVLSTHRVGAGPVALAFDGSSIWVANAKNDTVVTQRAFDGEHVWVETRVGDFPSSLTFDGGNVWVANGLGDSVSKISASDGVVLATFPAGRDPNAVVYDGENIWVANGPGQRRYQAQAVGWSHPGHLPRGLRKRTDL